MIHKHIGGKKNQRSVKNSLDYLLRTNKPEEQKFVEILSQTNRSDIENFNEYIKEKNFKNQQTENNQRSVVRSRFKPH